MARSRSTAPPGLEHIGRLQLLTPAHAHVTCTCTCIPDTGFRHAGAHRAVHRLDHHDADPHVPSPPQPPRLPHPALIPPLLPTPPCAVLPVSVPSAFTACTNPSFKHDQMPARARLHFAPQASLEPSSRGTSSAKLETQRVCVSNDKQRTKEN